MEDALVIAIEIELNLYGYQLLTQGEQDKAIDLFQLNTQRFPKERKHMGQPRRSPRTERR